jgi:uncharacterized membrane protein
VERRDRFVRFHAAQAIITFGAHALCIMLCGTLAIVSLSFLPSAFTPLISLAALTWIASVVLWMMAMWKAASGDEWRIPVAADYADVLLLRASAAASS